LLLDRKAKSDDLDELSAYLQISGQVSTALELLSQMLFQRTLSLIEENLTIALQEVLEQPIHLKTEADWKRGAATVEFWIEREGKPEDIMKGQGGSVANVLSVGLRMFALTALDESVHRRFLVLDEQDCWIRPALVPRLVRVVRAAGKTLGFQVIMISHHDVSAFEHYADRVYEFRPVGNNEVEVRRLFGGPLQEDQE
jgi:ABC-type glutathione transport system ATPase component